MYIVHSADIIYIQGELNKTGIIDDLDKIFKNPKKNFELKFAVNVIKL